MSKALERVRELIENAPRVILDCGTGTGFVTKQVAEFFPNTQIIAADGLLNMLKLARDNCANISDRVLFINADTFNLPIADSSVDIILAQNTIPAFHEFNRVLKPSGMVIYVDTSSGWITNLAINLVKRHNIFLNVVGAKAEMGFYVIAQKAAESNGQELPEPTSPQKILCCPIDRTEFLSHSEGLRCKQGHYFLINDGFPVLLEQAVKNETH